MIETAAAVESVANVLDRELQPLIADWLGRVEEVPDLKRIPLNREERMGHLPKLMHGVTARVRMDTEMKARISKSAGPTRRIAKQTRLHGRDAD
jgi:hypothetical protein